MTLDFPDPDKRICVLTDAFYCFYAVLVAQIHEQQLDLPVEEQDHHPLAILSGEVKGAQLRWTVPEKEDFAIFDTVTKMDHLFKVMTSSRFCLAILASHTFTILSLQTLISRAMSNTSCNTGQSRCLCSLAAWSTSWASSTSGQRS
jgi:RNase H-like domain found in reverse transcriptase